MRKIFYCLPFLVGSAVQTLVHFHAGEVPIMSKLMTTNQSSSDRMVRSTCQPFFLDVGACKTPWVGLHSQPATVGCLVWGPHVQTWVHRFNKHLFSLLAFFFPLTTHLNTYFHVVTITAWKIISNFRVFFPLFSDLLETLSTLSQHFQTHHFCSWITTLSHWQATVHLFRKSCPSPLPAFYLFLSVDLSGVGLWQNIPVSLVSFGIIPTPFHKSLHRRL